MQDEKRFYVYVHRRKTDGRIFYVGKGSGNRAWVLKGKRNPYWVRVNKRHGTSVEICQRNMLERDAFLLEEWLIAKFRHEGFQITNLTNGGEGASGFEFSEEQKDKRRERATGRSHSQETKEKLSLLMLGNPKCGTKGVSHPSYDDVVRTFVNVDGRRYSGTSFDFSKAMQLPNSAVRKLVRDKFRSYFGWMIEGMQAKVAGRSKKDHHFWGVSGPSNPVCKKDIFIFKNDDGRCFKGTRSEFYTEFNLNKSCVSALIKGRQAKHKGWTLHENT